MKRNLLIITLLFLGSFVILLLGNIIIIGEKIASLSQVAWAEYAFYTLILVVFYAVVIRPVVRVHRAPQFPALSIDGEWNTAQLVAFGHKLADNCNYIPKDKSCPELRKLHQQRLREDLERYATSKEELVQIISKELKLLLDYFDGKEPESKLAKKIDQKVFEAKRNDQWRREYMSYQMELNQQYRNGKEEGRKEGIDDMSKLIKMLISENKYE